MGRLKAPGNGKRLAAAVLVVCVQASSSAMFIGSAGAGNASPLAVSVEPSEGLVDEGLVTLDVEGVEPFNHSYVAQCRAPAEPQDCRENFGIELSGDGPSLQLEVRVEALFQLRSGDEVDCRLAPGICVLKIQLLSGGTHSLSVQTGSVLLDFASDRPLAPAPVIRVTPSTGLDDGSVVTVEGSGFDPIDPLHGEAIGFVDLLQCIAPATGRRCGRSGSVTWVRTDSQGEFTASLRIARVVGRQRADCRVVPCAVLAVEAPDGDSAQVDIQFASAVGPGTGGPPPPTSALPRTPSFTG